ncbi:hypothetical protein Val02_09120 [Virgisporangium aliadipatigenens]|uniref:DUF4082 domain-containing protein n=1 Tax=Virgisporangium aliadipatigenens TaxID=741659 RepID=A0A8J3YFF6_9ACTN|nr:DUF4082 domain-containing protein [Virgisporangium aliadipatigenens]GIJ44026.1 hypothetical protein Val02_09120 [Virgisporangium aliadipatigenens]
MGGRLRVGMRVAGAAGAVACVAALTLTAPPVSAADRTVSFFTNSDTPEIASFEDSNAYDLGFRFTSDEDGTITKLRFYKGAKNTGEHTGSLWTIDGVLLATATFKNETATGWQTVAFAEPVAIKAHTDYVASYHTGAGFYSLSRGTFVERGLDSGPLHIPPAGSLYHSGAGFPDQVSPGHDNYWLDLVFRPTAQETPSPSPSVSGPASPSPSAAASASPTAVVTPTASRPASPGLPVTGSDIPLMAGAGLVLTGLGAVLFVLHRRRRTRFVA